MFPALKWISAEWFRGILFQQHWSDFTTELYANWAGIILLLLFSSSLLSLLNPLLFICLFIYFWKNYQFLVHSYFFFIILSSLLYYFYRMCCGLVYVLQESLRHALHTKIWHTVCLTWVDNGLSVVNGFSVSMMWLP